MKVYVVLCQEESCEENGSFAAHILGVYSDRDEANRVCAAHRRSEGAYPTQMLEMEVKIMEVRLLETDRLSQLTKEAELGRTYQ